MIGIISFIISFIFGFFAMCIATWIGKRTDIWWGILFLFVSSSIYLAMAIRLGMKGLL